MYYERTVEEKTNEAFLDGMDRLTQRFAAGELSQEEYNVQFAVLVEQLMKRNTNRLQSFCKRVDLDPFNLTDYPENLGLAIPQLTILLSTLSNSDE